jgi:hypothetical protein
MRNRVLKQLVAAGAGVALGAGTAHGAGAVTFEFRDAAGDPFGGVNETEVVRGGSFTFEVWLHAGSEQVAGVTFKTLFDQYPLTTPHTFTLTGVNRTGSNYDFPSGAFSSPEPLKPSNTTDLGAVTSDPGGWNTGNQFITKLTLAVSAGLPKGTYTIRPDPTWSVWIAPVSGDEFVFTGITPYTVHVVPEPGEYALAAGLGLAGFGLYRRYRQRRG